MTHRTTRFINAACLCAAIFVSALKFAQEPMQVIHEVKHDTSAPLRSLPAAIANPATLPPHLARPVLKPGIHPAGTAQPDTALQTTHLP